MRVISFARLTSVVKISITTQVAFPAVIEDFLGDIRKLNVEL
jgi:hypothetical protein